MLMAMCSVGSARTTLISHGRTASTTTSNSTAAPPAQQAVDLLEASYGAVMLFPPGRGSVGYIQIEGHGSLCYDAVTRM
jgi:hypothetical protein